MGCPSLVRVLLRLLLIRFSTTIATCYTYQTVENITVDCGSTTTADQVVDERLWLADHNASKHFALIDESTSDMSTASQASQQLLHGLDVPYLTARISHSQFTYSFPVSPGHKFIRLYFYPTSTYPGFESDPAFFSVSTGRDNRFTLLNNFTGEPSNPTSESVVYMREFVVNVGEDENKLNITFMPSSAIPTAYAFVNGIEVVSMPTNLYYSGDPLYLVWDSAGGSFSIGNDTALELMFRVNIGGTYIAPGDDTGMFRNWHQDQYYADNPHSLGAVVVDDDNTIALKFTSNAKNYTAPRAVYTTAQAMGPNKTNNERYNLTWRFPVDSGFTYLVRLHFCLLIDAYAYPGGDVFSIYVGTFKAENVMDVAGSAGGLGVPLYRDYPVMFGDLEGAQETTKVNLSVELHPAVHVTYHSDSFLNGVEIFKASSGNGDLAGIRFYAPQSNPISPDNDGSSSSSKKRSMFFIIGSVLAGLVVVLVLLLAALIVRRRSRKLVQVKDMATSSDGCTLWQDTFTTVAAISDDKSDKSQKASLPSELCRYFTLSEIRAATNNFDKIFIIGVGGFGDVYRGFISSLYTEVAIKRLKQGSEQGATEFKTEIEMLSQLRHLHLVSLIGYCNEDNEMILVYDYMSRGTLHDHLYNTDNPPLSWLKRLEICIGTARGLQYLHSGAKNTVIHRDVKTTNIVLDEKWDAKVSDFGLSKIGPNSATKAHISTVVKGSIGYLDPEYYRRQRLTEKSDVYSFGVVLCEVLCARPPVIRSVVRTPVSLAELC